MEDNKHTYPGITGDQQLNMAIFDDNDKVTSCESRATSDEKLITKGGSTHGQTKLKRNVTLLQGIALIVGVMIGSGIFITPRFVLEKSGSVGLMLIVWATCGFIAILGALCYCELGTLIQVAGGEYSYVKEAFGELPAFLISWGFILVTKPASLTIICFTFAYYICQPLFDHDNEPILLIKTVAALCIIVITIINCVSVQWAAQMQVLFMAAKLIAVGIIISIGAVRILEGHTDSLESPFKGTNENLGKIAHAFYNGLWAYDGWNQLNYITEELEDPNRNLPRAVLIALPLVTLCYVLINVAYLSVLSPKEVLSSSAVAVTMAEEVSPVLVILMPLFVACSCYGAANGSVFTNGRLVCAAAREGHMPKFLAEIHSKFHTPLRATVFPSIIAIIMLIPGDIDSVLNCFSFVSWLFYGVTVLSLIVLRWQRPSQPRPYEVWLGIPVMMILVSLYLIVAPFVDRPEESALALCFVLAGIPVYYMFVQ